MYLVLLLKLTASVMLFGIVGANILILLSWAGLGVLDSDWSFVPLWLILLALVLGFGQYVISSFLFGVCRQVLTGSGADLKDLPWSDKLSETIDQGWLSSAKTAMWSAVATLIIITAGSAIYFKDLVFLVALHRGMQMSAEGNSVAAQVWYKKCVWAAGPDREPVARFLLSGSLNQDKQYALAEGELLKALAAPSAKNDQTLLVWLYDGLCSSYVLQNKLSDAEVAAKKAVEIVEKNPNLPIIDLRLIASFSQPMIGAPTLKMTLRVLEIVYVKGKKCDLALDTYKRLFQAEQSDADLKWQDFVVELSRLNDLPVGDQEKDCAVEKQRVIEATKTFCMRKFSVNESEFTALLNSK